MLIAKAKRTDLLHIGVREWLAQSAETLPTPGTDGCILVWDDKAGAMPDAVVVADGALQSFLAWTTTYLPHLTPITALVEVAEHREYASRATGRRVDRSVGMSELGVAFLRGCLGILHAEVVAACRGSFAPTYAGLTPYVSTFSWLALQQQTQCPHEGELQTLREGWDEARKLLEATRVGYASYDVEDVWALISNPDVGSGAKQSRDVKQIAAFLDSVQPGKYSPDALDIAKEHSHVLDTLETGPLESRVEVFRKLVRSLYDLPNPPAGHAVLLGFALSLISQGSFSHIGLLGRSRVSDMRPLLWYGWFDFYRHPPEAASPAVSGASLQLLKALRGSCSPWLRRDIAIDELRVLSRQKEPFADCLLDIRHPIGVEIAAGAVSHIQPGTRGSDRERGRHPQRSLFDDEP